MYYLSTEEWDTKVYPSDTEPSTQVVKSYRRHNLQDHLYVCITGPCNVGYPEIVLLDHESKTPFNESFYNSL